MDAKELEGGLGRLFPGKSVLVTGPLFSGAERFIYYSTSRFLSSEKDNGAIWISTDTPYEKIKDKFAEYGFPAGQASGRGSIHFLDMISHRAGVTRKKCDDCRYMQDPSNLTELALAINEVLAKKKCGLVVLDSLNSLLVYNDLTKTLQFLRFLSASVYDRKMALLVYFVSGEHEPRTETSARMASDIVVSFEQDIVTLHGGSTQKAFRFEFAKGGLKLSKP